jgi:hypothetical protein
MNKMREVTLKVQQKWEGTGRDWWKMQSEETKDKQ